MTGSEASACKRGMVRVGTYRTPAAVHHTNVPACFVARWRTQSCATWRRWQSEGRGVPAPDPRAPLRTCHRWRLLPPHLPHSPRHRRHHRRRRFHARRCATQGGRRIAPPPRPGWPRYPIRCRRRCHHPDRGGMPSHRDAPTHSPGQQSSDRTMPPRATPEAAVRLP